MVMWISSSLTKSMLAHHLCHTAERKTAAWLKGRSNALSGSRDCSTRSIPNAKFLDGAAVVQMLNPGTAKTFLDYAEQVCLPTIPLVLTLFGMFIKQIDR